MDSIPQNIPLEDQRERRSAIEHRRSQFKWVYPQGLPPFVLEIPESEQSSKDVVDFLVKLGTRYTKAQIEGKINQAEETFKKLFGGSDNDPMNVFECLYDREDVPNIAHLWRSDEFFGNQRLNGLVPEDVRRCTAVPANLAVKDADLSGLLPSGQTLATLASSGLLYYTSYPQLDGVVSGLEKDFICAPVCLFLSDPVAKTLKPLAIQLTQSAGPIYTPKDPANLWMCVKLAANRAMFAVHMPHYHVLRFHFVLESLYVSLNRQVSENHPVALMLKPFFRNHLFANKQARGMTLQEVPYYADVAKRFWAEMQTAGAYGYFDFPKNLAARGVDDATKLPSYYFRDEGLVMWNAVRNFVSDIVGSAYKSDAEVASDYEMQHWIRELRDPICVNFTGLPNLDSMKNLIDLLTNVIFAVSIHHSYSTTAGDYYGFAPASPATFNFKPPAAKPAEMTPQQVRDLMPSLDRCVHQMAEIESISVNTFNPLGKSFPQDYLVGLKNGQDAVRNFASRLTKVQTAMEERVKERSKGKREGFDFFLPSKMATSVWN